VPILLVELRDVGARVADERAIHDDAHLARSQRVGAGAHRSIEDVEEPVVRRLRVR